MNRCDHAGQNALHHATKNKCEDTFELLLKSGKGVKLDARDASGNNALHLAAARGYRWISASLGRVRDLRVAKNNEGFTPLDLATMRGHNTEGEFDKILAS